MPTRDEKSKEGKTWSLAFCQKRCKRMCCNDNMVQAQRFVANIKRTAVSVLEHYVQMANGWFKRDRAHLACDEHI